MNIIFFGSSKYSQIVEESIFNAVGLSLVVTIPDRIIGREKILTPSPVKVFAEKNNIPFVTYDKLDDEAIQQIAEYKPDFLVVADYGLILPKKLLELPSKAPLNVHHSLLPKYRGTSPAPSAILAGDHVSGVTIIKMNDRVDAGDIMAQQTYELQLDETTESLLTRLNTIGGQIIVPVIENYDQIKPIPQDESHATFTKPMTKEDGYIDLTVISNSPKADERSQGDFSVSPRNDKVWFERAVRAYYPWPGVWTKIRIKDKEIRIKFLPDLSVIASETKQSRPFLLQPEGKKPMSVKDFLNGYPEAREIVEKFL